MDSYSETSSDESFKPVSRKNTHKCTYEGCGATFYKNSKLQYHLRRHTGERPFVCDEPNCGKTYFYSFHLRRHKLNHSNAVRKPIPCTFEGCYLELANEFSLKKHIKRKHNCEKEYPFHCKDCKQGFNKKRQLLQHTYVHTGVYPFKCDVCESPFPTLRDCNRHKRTHKSYTCECGKSFERWSILLEHKRTACKFNQRKCNICNKLFSHREVLRQHLEIHSRGDINTKYKCTYENCDRSYLYKKNLACHIKKFHEKVKSPKIKCDQCDKKLSKNQNLRLHIEKFHSTTKNSRKKKTPRRPRKDKGTIKQVMNINLSAKISSLNPEGCGPSNFQENALKDKISCSEGSHETLVKPVC